MKINKKLNSGAVKLISSATLDRLKYRLTTTKYQSDTFTAPGITEKKRFAVQEFLNKWEYIQTFLQICPHLTEKYLMQSFALCSLNENNAWLSGKGKKQLLKVLLIIG